MQTKDERTKMKKRYIVTIEVEVTEENNDVTDASVEKELKSYFRIHNVLPTFINSFLLNFDWEHIKILNLKDPSLG